MLFTTPLFLFIFLPLFLITYYIVPHAKKNFIALIASILFFAWGEPVFVFLLILGTYIDYQASLYIAPENQLSTAYKKLILMTTIAINVCILIASKYAHFICTDLMLMLIGHPLHTSLSSLPLILGISFITFHKVSYLVDSYQGRATPPRHFFDCALYIFLFPQLIAGPIIRYHDIGLQIQARQHTPSGFLIGFARFSLGLVKKLLIADPLGRAADAIFNTPPSTLSILLAWGGITAYTLQIYFDFSGYSDMAIGLGKMMGFRFPENFNRPYVSKSITEFWQRWHISLSNWMRLYLYIPLGGNRGTLVKTYLNLWIVFLISGLWHGASWNFIVWGAYYGFFLCIERFFSSTQLSKTIALPNIACQLLTLFIVMIGWVFFRSPTLTYAMDYLHVMFGLAGVPQIQALPWGIIFNNQVLITLLVGSFFATLPLPDLTTLSTQKWFSLWSANMDTESILVMSLQFLIIIPFLILSIGAIATADYAPFLYFRF